MDKESWRFCFCGETKTNRWCPIIVVLRFGVSAYVFSPGEFSTVEERRVRAEPERLWSDLRRRTAALWQRQQAQARRWGVRECRQGRSSPAVGSRSEAGTDDGKSEWEKSPVR